MYLRDWTALLLVVSGGAIQAGRAQTVTPGGVVNAASFQAPVAPGSLISIFGTDLAATTLAATAAPYPTSLGGVSVVVNGSLAAPLFAVSPGQVNAQLPYETPTGTATLSVNGSARASFAVAASAPGVLAYGSNRAVALNQNYSMNGPQQPAAAGSVITVFGTGQGAVEPPVATGEAAPGDPLSRPVLPVAASIGGQAADVLFAGLAPGYMGTLQLNLRVPNLASGDYPLVVTIGGAQSNAPLVAVAGSGNTNPSIARTIAYHQITSYAESDANGYRGATAISGNGALIAFAHDVSPTRGQNQVYAMNFDGTNVRLVDSYSARCFCGSTMVMSEDAAKMAITEGRQIRTAGNSGGSALLTAEDGAVSGISGLALEGDGRRIFFLVGRDTRFGPGPNPVGFLRGLYVMNWDGSGLRQIVGPDAVAALLGTTASSYYIPEFTSTGNGPSYSLSVSYDGAHIVFAAKARGNEGVFGVNLDGSNLHLVVGPVPYVQKVAISRDGRKVLYNATVSGSMVDTGAVNFDGTGRVRLRQDGLGNAPAVSLTADGSVLLAYDILYNTDGSGALQLGTLLNAFTLGSSASGSAVMNLAGTRFVYSWVPPKTYAQGFSQMVTAEINPGHLGSAPSFANISTNPNYAVAGGNPLSTVTASVSPYDRVLGVNYALVRDGLVEDPVTGNIELGPIPSTNGIFSAQNVEAKARAPVGPRLLRLFAWVKDAGGAWHGTLIDVTPYSVVLEPPVPGGPPSGSPVLSASPTSLDFGTVAVGQSRALTLTVRNTGSAAVTLTGSVAGPFRLQPASFSLNAGAEQAVEVRFTPVDSTRHDTTITFRGDDAAASTLTVGVGGAGESAVVITSDSFQRADSAHNVLGVTDLGLGGTHTYCYIPIWTGASIVSNSLENWQTGAGGVQFGQPGSGGSCSFRGQDMGQTFNIRVDVLVPADAAGNSTVAGPYFHSRGAAAADGILGGDAAGYWVQLGSSGKVSIVDKHRAATFANTSTPASFDRTVFHTLEAAVTGTTVQAALDGSLLTFTLGDGTSAETVTIPYSGGSNDGTAGIGFQRSGAIGGQRARNLVVTEYRALAGP